MISEILAPAGNMEMLSPAVYCGADAVYLGLESLNARRGAKGFSEAELVQAVSFCHARNVRVYVALNTIVYNSELPHACEAVRIVCRAGADAVIVQDLAMAAIVKEIAPELAIHGSTQMSVHSLSGAVMLRKMGFSRVILSRELSLIEIEHITKNAGIETEVFVHGALCMSISGQCYMSAFLGGRSGNRGSCAGPCRLPFSASEPGLCHLSLKDMSHISHLPQLRDAGVSSFKIEGRLRKNEYVAASVNACVCSLAGQKYDADILQNVFSRSGFTDGYIKNRRDGHMFGIRTEDDSAAAKKAEPQLRELYRRERQCVPVSLTLKISGSKLTLTAEDLNKNTCEAEAEFEPQPAETDTRPALLRALSKCGGTPFTAQQTFIEGGEGIYVPQAIVNELRREALLLLLQKRSENRPHEIKPYTAPSFTAQRHDKKGVIIRFESAEQLFDFPQEICRVIAPLYEYEKIPLKIRAITWLELPRAMFAKADEEVKSLIAQASELGFGGYVAENISHFELLRGKRVMGGFGLNIANPLAAREYRALGAELLTLSCEIMCSEMPFFEGETAALAYAHMPLMLTRACPLQNVRTCAGCPKSGTLLDRKGVRLPLRCKNDVRTIYNPVPLYMGDKRGELCTDYDILYFTVESRAEAQETASAFLRNAAFDGDFTRGLYFKGTN